MQQIGLDATLNNVPDFTGGIDKMNRAVDSFAQNGKQAGDGFGSGFGEIVTGALRKVGELAVEALLKASQAVAGFVKDSIGLAGDFQAGMLEFQSVAGKAVDTKGLEQFHDLFLDLGKELPVSTSEVQQAAIEMVKGGIDPATIAAGGLKQNIQFAAAAMGGDLVKAAEISSKILGGWAEVNASGAEKADFLTHATDLLAKAANASSTDVEGLSRGIFQSQGIAKAAGVEFDDLVTTLAELAPRFGSSAEAGTSLKNLIARLQPTTANATLAMKDLGLMTEDGKNKFFDAQGTFIGFQAASELLKGSVEGLTDKQKALELQMIFGNDAMSAASALSELGAAGYANMADALENANGVADAAALKQQGFNTALDNAKGSVEALQITLGEKLLPVLTDLLNNTIAPAINAVTDFASALFETNDPVDLLISALDDFSPLLAGIVSFIGTAVVTTWKFVSALQNTNDPVDLLISTLDDFSPLLADIVIIIGSAVVSFQRWMHASDGLGGAVQDLSGIWEKYIGVVENVMSAYMAIAEAVLPIVQRFVDEHGTQISAFFKSAYDKIISIVNTALDLYDAVVPKALNEVAGWIDAHATGIQSVLSGAWGAITGIIDGALTLIEGTLKIALDIIHGDWAKAWTDLQAMSARFVQDIGQIIGGFLDVIAGLFNTSMADIVQVWEDNWTVLVDIATETDWASVGESVVSGILDGLRSNWDSLMGWVSDKVSGLVDSALSAIGAGSPAKDFMPVGEFIVTGIMQGLSDTWPQLTSLVGTLADDLTSKMQDIGGQMQDAIASGFGATASIDRQIARNLDKFKDVLPQYEQYTSGALKEAELKAGEFLDPAQGAKFFKMRSDQILEYAKLQKDLSEATSQEDKDRISQQMLLINKAQQAEIDQFNATTQAQGPMVDIANQINDIMKTIAGINLTDDQIKIVEMLTGVYDRLSTPPNTQRTPYNPGATSTTNSTVLNMPIYTNNSPSAMQQSMAIASAALL